MGLDTSFLADTGAILFENIVLTCEIIYYFRNSIRKVKGREIKLDINKLNCVDILISFRKNIVILFVELE